MPEADKIFDTALRQIQTAATVPALLKMQPCSLLLIRQQFAIEIRNQIVVFEVACSARWSIDLGGSIDIIFDSAPANYQVMCPMVQVDLLTVPDGPLEAV